MLVPNRPAILSIKVPPPAHDIGDLDRTYAVIRELGRGGMGAVVLARHREAGHRVAIKIASTDKFDVEGLARFQREARLMARFQHPNIVRLYDVRQIASGRVAIVMEYVRGVSLARLIRDQKRLPFSTCTGILRDLGNALAHAHEHGVVHRDVKPPNVLVEEGTGVAKLSDFGIAKVTSDEAQVTAVGAVLGTPAYMSPEQIDGRGIDGRSDIYALGVLGWEIVSGEHPWAGIPLFELLFKQKHEALPPLSALRPDTPRALLLAIEGALEKDPAHRWESVTDMVAQLASDEPTAAMVERRKRRAVALRARPAGATIEAATVPVPRRRTRSQANAPSTSETPTDRGAGQAPAPAGAPGQPTFGHRRWRPTVLIGAGAAAGGFSVLLALRLFMAPAGNAGPIAPAQVVSDSSAKDSVAGATILRPAPTDFRDVVAGAVSRGRAGGDRFSAPPRGAGALAPPSAAIVPATLPRVAQAVAGGGDVSGSDATFERRAHAYALSVRARTLAYSGNAERASAVVDSALTIDALSGAAYGLRARLRISRGDVRDAWTDIELAARTGARWEALALTTMLKARELGAAAARERLTGELRDALVPVRMLDAERAVALAVALAQVGDTATALTLLERASPMDSRLPQLLADPLLAPLHASSRYVEVMRQAKD
jgi:serine/threonine protein kinase